MEYSCDRISLIFIKFYCRHVTGEITQEWQTVEDATQKDKLYTLVKEIIPYLMEHNAEAEACDALMEIEKIDTLHDYVDESAFPRVCLYLTRYVYLSITFDCIIGNFSHRIIF